MTTFLDTNVLVYAFDTGDQRKQAIALDLIEGEADWVVSAQVLSEFFVTVTRKLSTPMSVTDAAAVVSQLAKLTSVPTDTTLIRSAIATVQQHQLSYWDALIVEAAAAAGCNVLLSEDLAPGSTLRGVRIENPFA